ncbi:Pre-rRNA-processing protein PNO1-like protein [Aduncisulcus paluster]|uniref:Pre-rRNA-processing protein PNO1-like protein n=1 Tax=Aduncisulcus paluster TaxID=2918883 RepID=A0ABQ5K6F6_9EUKA|nr:Pre-rRNA-processing protein PNO1-like protein [Aduncisulcus paluster]
MSKESLEPKKVVEIQERKIIVPSHRFTPLRKNWMEIYSPIVEQLKLDIRIISRRRIIEMRTNQNTVRHDALQKATEFVQAFLVGFAVEDALALVRLDDLFVDSFAFEDVKLIKGDHLSRAIGRVSGKGGEVKKKIETATSTRIVIAGHRVHILGSYERIRIAKRAISEIIMGSPPGKVYARLQRLASLSSSIL